MSVPLPSAGRRPTAAAPHGRMTALVTSRYGGPDALAPAQVPVPVPSRRQVLVQVASSSVNPLDLHLLTGTPYLVRLVNGATRPRRPVPGVDVAGVVVACGPGVTDLQVGDAVLGLADGGAFAEYAAVDAARLTRVPVGVDLGTVGTVPLAGLTALQGLRTHGRVAAGERVLVLGASGGVGTSAVQLARILGAAEVVAVCSTANVAQAHALGATRVIDYRTTDVVAAGGRCDVVLDMVGSLAGERLLELLAPGGRYVAVNGPDGNRWLGPVPHLLRTRRRFRGSGRTFHQFTVAPRPEDLRFLAEHLASGGLAPVVHRRVGLAGVPDALQEIAGGHTPGKIVVDVRALTDGRGRDGARAVVA